MLYEQMLHSLFSIFIFTIICQHSITLCNSSAGAGSVGVDPDPESKADPPLPEQFEIPYVSASDLRESYDFIVVGAGVAGSVVAARLATHASHPSVLLMEAGRKASTSYASTERIPALVAKNQLTEIDWQYKTTAQKHMAGAYNDREMRWPRGKVFGGSGVLNFMMFVRGHRQDWDTVMRNQEKNVSGWQWRDVLPFFKMTETVIPPRNADADAGGDGDGEDLIDDAVRGRNGPIVVNYPQTLIGSSRFTDEFVRAAMENGLPFSYDHNDGDLTSLGVAYTQYNVNRDGYRANSFLSYMQNVVMADEHYAGGDIHLDLLPRAHATRILFANNNESECHSDAFKRQTAIGVEFVDLDTNVTHEIRLSSLTRGEVVVSGGSIGSPHLLMLSGMGPRQHLQDMGIEVVEDIPGVGQNLQDHISYFLRYYVPHNTQAPRHERSLGHEVYTQANYRTHPEFLRTSADNAQLYFSTSFNNDEYKYMSADSDSETGSESTKTWSQLVPPDIQVIFAQGMFANEKYQNFQKGYFQADEYGCGSAADDEIPSDFYADLDDMQNFVLHVTLHHPQSIGEITLRSADAFEYPSINPNYFAVEEDLLRLMEGVRLSQSMIENSRLKSVFGVKAIVCRGKYGDMNANDANLKRYLRDLSQTLYHPIGTCKYGNLARDEMAVVSSATLLLKHASNVRVIDASVMPRQTSANTQAPTCMIGEKGAFHILQTWQKNLHGHAKQRAACSVQ